MQLETLTMTQTSPSYSPELLEVFRIGLINQLMDRQRVIEWADDLINKESEPTYFLIELSLCGRNHLNDMISLLDKYVGENKPQVAGRAVLGYLYHQYYGGHIPLQRVVGTFYWLSLHSPLSEQEQRSMYGLEIDLELAADGVCGTVAAVEEHILRFLTIYQEFNIDNMLQWNEINRHIPDRLQVFYQQESNK
jgi:hypothetical protein